MPILTISDAGARGERKDTSGDAIEAWAKKNKHEMVARTLVPDESLDIVRTLSSWVRRRRRGSHHHHQAGAGLSARDVKRQAATKTVLEREAPGIASWVRDFKAKEFPRAVLSRGLAGTSGKNADCEPAGITGRRARRVGSVGSDSGSRRGCSSRRRDRPFVKGLETEVPAERKRSSASSPQSAFRWRCGPPVAARRYLPIA